MRWVHAEYILKGVFLALLAYAALVLPDAASAALVGCCLLGGLIAGLVVASWRARRDGISPAGNAVAYVLFLLLEQPRQIYGGTLAGLMLGVLLVGHGDTNAWVMPAFVAAGIVLGLGLAALKMVRHRWYRFGIGLGVATALAAGGLLALEYWPDFVPEAQRRAFGMYLLLGLPFFYLLTFVGEAEESEVEAAAWCSALAVGVWLVKVTPGIPALALIIPLTLYYLYTTRVLPGLRVFKHTLRGISYARVGQPREALASLHRAVYLDPENSLARSALWSVHRDLDAAAIASDPLLVELIDPHLCLDRVARLLDEPPSAAQLAEAKHLLDLLERRGAAVAAPVAYWRAVAALHAKDDESAGQMLERLLDPTAWPPGDAGRDTVLFSAWQLALLQHAGLERRVGTPQLQRHGRRLEAIACVERILAEAPQDSTAWGLKRILYAGLTEGDLGPNATIDAAYVEQLGLALLDDPARVRRGAEYLGIAAGGMPPEAPRLWARAADALEKDNDTAGARRARERGRAAGVAFGPKNLPDGSRQVFFALVKHLAEDATAAGDYDAAVGHWRLFSEYEKSGIETLRQIADLHERRGDALAALKTVEEALLYNKKDPDLLARRDQYCYSLQPDDLRRAPEAAQQAVDVAYCLAKAKQILDHRDADAEQLDWARHLTELALVREPNGFPARVLAARAALRFGERDRALQWLEDVREGKPEKWASSADEQAWQTANKLLGDLYLDELDRPDLAIACFQDYRKSDKSGADTLYKLGMACERLGEPKRAAKFYEQVLHYQQHPRASDAEVALQRVKSLS